MYTRNQNQTTTEQQNTVIFFSPSVKTSIDLASEYLHLRIHRVQLAFVEIAVDIKRTLLWRAVLLEWEPLYAAGCPVWVTG